MIRTITLFAATSFVSVALACGEQANGKSGCPMAAAKAAETAQADVAEADGAKVALSVSGMTCGSCASAVQAALLKVEGVTAAFVSAEDGRAEIAFDDQKTDVDALIAAVSSTGKYSAAKADAAVN